LKIIYDALGINCRAVFATRCCYPSQMVDGRLSKEPVNGHAWLKVTIDGTELDVCPGSENNRPGVVNFTVLSGVKTLFPAIQPITHILTIATETLR
jgi:hypothetical protein